jgi:5-methylcytosine-specific restriction enzyme subunit McrC
MILKSTNSGSAFTQESVYYMLMYAWRMWPGGHVAPAANSVIDAPSDLIARLLANSIRKAYASGLQRNYITVQEETMMPSGRILMHETLRNRSQKKQSIHVERDSFSVDCIPNQILRYAAYVLLSLKLNQETRVELSEALSKLQNVSDINIDDRLILTEMQRTRRLEYRIGLSIALTIKQGKVLVPSGSGAILSEAPRIGDDIWFRGLFESFLREFYRHNLSSVKVGGRRYLWSSGEDDLFPIMQTDINIETEKSILVMDAKCTPKVTSKRQDYKKQTLNSGHLYQVFTYMSYCSDINSGKKINGALIYPLYQNEVDTYTDTPNGKLRVKTVDFKRDWVDIRDELLEVVYSAL